MSTEPQTSMAGRSHAQPAFRLAAFSADVTVPLGHRLMGVLPTKAREIVDPLTVNGFVLLGADKPIVLAAVDWCEIRNAAYDQWRDTLAAAAGTTRARVLVCCLHQHDAPVVDTGAEELLAEAGLGGELFDSEFHEVAVRRAADALRQSIKQARPITHLGLGQARVEKVASNRRVVYPDGHVDYRRSSGSGGEPFYADAPEGLIDPWLKTISFWDQGRPILALHCYATHPMSYYGQGGVSADFIGMARERRRQDDPAVFQIYVTGCSGDVTAGKYNDGSPENRPVLADRLYRAMKEAWSNTKRHRLEMIDFRQAELELEFNQDQAFTEEALRVTLKDKNAETADRILAAMGLSTLRRLAQGHKIDLPCIDLGPAQVVLLPGEAFVGYQLMAQQIRPEAFVMAVGYGECWPGYIPTDAALSDGFGHGWRWVDEGSETRVHAALQRVLTSEEDGRTPKTPPGSATEESANDGPGFEVKLETILKHDDGNWLWFHPRAASILRAGDGGEPAVVLTLQRHLMTDDHYSGLYVMRTDDLGRSWRGPEAVPELDWVRESDYVTSAVTDVTPGWHAPTGKLIAIGARVRYSEQGWELEDVPRAHQTAYAVYDPKERSWSRWKILHMPEEEKFNFARSACAQWLVQRDGTLLLPFYFGPSATTPYSVTVVRCSFDGDTIRYQAHGDELSLNVARGLYEPSLVHLQGRYFLTIRNDLRGYVTASEDGLHYQPIKPWTFDDGADLGSYNTQQHWLAHSDGLFLVYTRRGASNDHVIRHRAPLFMARVDTEKLCVIRASERIVVPERGAALGNFGAAMIDENESWVTVSEGLFGEARKHGAQGSTFVARVLWSKPNSLFKSGP